MNIKIKSRKLIDPTRSKTEELLIRNESVLRTAYIGYEKALLNDDLFNQKEMLGWIVIYAQRALDLHKELRQENKQTRTRNTLLDNDKSFLEKYHIHIASLGLCIAGYLIYTELKK